MFIPTVLPRLLTRTMNSLALTALLKPSTLALNAIPGDASQKDVLAGVRAAVDAFVKEAPQFDDLTMLGLKYNGPVENAVAEDHHDGA